MCDRTNSPGRHVQLPYLDLLVDSRHVQILFWTTRCKYPGKTDFSLICVSGSLSYM